ncbi:hypothetical protein MN202_15335 [Rheinheimera muenzenbergensis]|uniref:DUF2306 domain-containing protein n=1 Tax=Rheinheimera muenzenbergensis TaxID=1193628 RepID=A0ABU8C9F6_9GAMM
MLTYLHILTGTVALVSGTLSFAVMKGGNLHRKFGLTFVLSMIVMTTSGALLAFISKETLNMVAGLVTFYLVTTAFLTVHPPKQHARIVHSVLMMLGFAIGIYAIYTGLTLLHNGKTSIDGQPIQVIMVFGSISLLAAISDIRLMTQERLSRKSQLVRHVWRIGFTLFIATASFFLGQSQVIPEVIRHGVTLAAPVLLVLCLTTYWLVRVSIWGLKRRA